MTGGRPDSPAQRRVTSRIVAGTAAVLVLVSAVSLAATYVAGTDAAVEVADEAEAYGASESLLTALTAAHARLSEATTSTAALPEGSVDEGRMEMTRAAVDEVGVRLSLFPPEDLETVEGPSASFVGAVEAVLEDLDEGVLPSDSGIEAVDDSYRAAVDATDSIRREAAVAIASARDEAGALATAARAFVIIVVPVLTLTALYRALRMRHERRELEMRLEGEKRLREERDRLIEAVGHELRTPLTAVVGLSAALRESRDLSAGERAEMVATIADQSRELGERIDDLITVSRLDSGLLAMAPERIDARSVVDRALAERWAAGPESVTVTGRGMAKADPRHLEHVIRNLVTCAIRSGAASLEVLVYRRSLTLTIEIRDNGSEAQATDLTGEATADGPATVGLGICMATARRLTESMGGTLERKRFEGGNLALVRFPLVPVRYDDPAGAGVDGSSSDDQVISLLP